MCPLGTSSIIYNALQTPIMKLADQSLKGNGASGPFIRLQTTLKELTFDEKLQEWEAVGIDQCGGRVGGYFDHVVLAIPPRALNQLQLPKLLTDHFQAQSYDTYVSLSDFLHRVSSVQFSKR